MALFRCVSGGGGTKCYTETLASATAGVQTITCGFEPKRIIVYDLNMTSGGSMSSTASIAIVYDKDNYNYQCRMTYSNGTPNFSVLPFVDIEEGNMRIRNTTSNGFTIAISSTYAGHNFYIIALE